MTAKDDAFAQVEKAYVEFRDLITMLPDDAYSEVFAGTWALDQLLAHMAGWYRELVPELGRIAAGNPTPFSEYSDFDSWNARFAAQAQHGMAALDDFDMAFHEFYAAAKALPEEHFGLDPEGKPLPAGAFFVELVTGHTAQHRPDIEAWLTARGQ
jgi:hypothetical protein